MSKNVSYVSMEHEERLSIQAVVYSRGSKIMYRKQEHEWLIYKSNLAKLLFLCDRRVQWVINNFF